jgi:hypothetical protein
MRSPCDIEKTNVIVLRMNESFVLKNEYQHSEYRVMHLLHSLKPHPNPMEYMVFRFDLKAIEKVY